MAQQNNQIDPATATVLQAMNKISPVTPEGRPTVAAEVLNAAAQMGGSQMSPSVGQAAEQAGIAAQLENMRIRRAQEAMMNQAMQASQPPGIEGLNSGIQGYAEGGILGYAGKDESVAVDPGSEGGSSYTEQIKKVAALLGLPFAAAADLIALPYSQYKNIREPDFGYTPASDVLRRVIDGPSAKPLSIAEESAREAARFAQDVPYGTEGPAQRIATEEQAPAQKQRAPAAPAAARAPGLAASSAPAFAELFSEFEKLKKMPTTGTPEDAIERATKTREAMDQYVRSRGGDPDLVNKMMADYERVYGEQLGKVEARRAAAQERAERGGMSAWLRGFRQLKGQGVGEGFRTAAEAGEAFDEAMRNRIERLEDMGLEIQRTRMEKVNALKNQKYLTDTGDFVNARKEGDAAADAARREQILLLQFKQFQAGEASQEARTAATIRSQEAARAESTALRTEQEKQRTLLAAQGRLTEAEKLRATVADKVKTVLALPKDTKDPMTRQMRENAELEMRQADENVASARALYNNMLNQSLGIAGAAPVTGGKGAFKLVSVQPGPR